MSRNICITSGDGQTGHLVAELLLTDGTFSKKFKSVAVLAMDPSKCDDLAKLGAVVVPHIPGKKKKLVELMKEALPNGDKDVVFLIPPAKGNKRELVEEMIEVVRAVGTKNTVMLSSAGADLAEKDKQPRLREFIELEALFMWNKGDTSTEAGHSPCIIRAGFYAENLLLYNKYTQSSGKLPLPIGTMHKFAPVALGDIALVAAHVLTGEGPHGLADKHRGQLITQTGPMLTAGNELAEAASQALGIKMEFEDISPEEAKELLDSDAEVDESEKEYLLEYYSLVREGKSNYVSTIAGIAITGAEPQVPTEFFKTYGVEFKPKRRRTKK